MFSTTYISAMHHSLRIPEILAYIFQYALQTSDDGRAVLNLALTCQTFKDPALATLWRSMDSLVPLVKCLPRDCWEERARDGGETLVRIAEFFGIEHPLTSCKVH